jgi:hypothetical protein
MKVNKFNEAFAANDDRVFLPGGKKIFQRTIDYYNKEGYKLYYYKDFKLHEIEKLSDFKTGGSSSNPFGVEWNKWGDMIFFLNEEEYLQSSKMIETSKKLYDKYIEQAENVAKLPLSHIYYDVLKMEGGIKEGE